MPVWLARARGYKAPKGDLGPKAEPSRDPQRKARSISKSSFFFSVWPRSLFAEDGAGVALSSTEVREEPALTHERNTVGVGRELCTFVVFAKNEAFGGGWNHRRLLTMVFIKINS